MVGLAGSATNVAAQKSELTVNNVRLWHSPNKTRVVFDISADIKHRIFRLDNPSRVVIDIENAGLAISLPTVDANNRHLKSLRYGQPESGVLRFVLELKTSLEEHSFVLNPNELYGYRLVVDLLDNVEQQQVADRNDETAPTPEQPVNEVVAEPPVAAKPEATAVIMMPPERKKFIVAIDAGHGGEDPGAIGYKGSREKKITLQIAERLKRVIKGDKRMEAKLIRTGDYYIDLHKRRQMARDKGADIFVSIHADAVGICSVTKRCYECHGQSISG